MKTRQRIRQFYKAKIVEGDLNTGGVIFCTKQRSKKQGGAEYQFVSLRELIRLVGWNGK